MGIEVCFACHHKGPMRISADKLGFGWPELIYPNRQAI
jgi:hypothetical protein